MRDLGSGREREGGAVGVRVAAPRAVVRPRARDERAGGFRGVDARENVSGWDGDDARALGVEDGDRGVGGTRADLAVGTRGGSGVAGPGGVWGYRADALDGESSARVAAYHRARRAVSGQRHERRGVGTTRARDGGPVQRDDRGGVDRGSVRAEGHDDARVAREGLAVVGDGRHLDAGGGDVRQRAE